MAEACNLIFIGGFLEIGAHLLDQVFRILSVPAYLIGHIPLCMATARIRCVWHCEKPQRQGLGLKVLVAE